MARKKAPSKKKVRKPTSSEPSKALAKREKETKELEELQVAQRMMEVEALMQHAMPKSQIVAQKKKEWGVEEGEVLQVMDGIYKMWRVLNVDTNWRQDRANLSRYRAEMVFRRSLGGSPSDKNRYLGTALKALEHLAKMDGSYEPERLEVTAHHPELAHMGYASEDEILEAIDRIRAEVYPALLGEVIDIEGSE